MKTQTSDPRRKSMVLRTVMLTMIINVLISAFAPEPSIQTRPILIGISILAILLGALVARKADQQVDFGLQSRILGVALVCAVTGAYWTIHTLLI